MNYVALDIGNVLVHTNFQSFLKKLSKSLNITMEEAMYFMNRTQKLHDLGCTQMSDELRDHFKIRSPIVIDELLDYWLNVIDTADYVLDLFQKLMQKNDLQVALLSNIGLEHASQISTLLNYYDKFFDKSITHFSCYVGARKPTVIYYQSFLQLHPEFYGCPYVDDLQENLDASKQFGFKTHRFSLEEITGANYEKSKFNGKMAELEKFVLGQPI